MESIDGILTSDSALKVLMRDPIRIKAQVPMYRARDRHRDCI